MIRRTSHPDASGGHAARESRAGGARLSFGRRLAALAQRHGDQPALIVVSADGATRGIGWLELESDTNRMARHLAWAGAQEGRMLVVALPNSVEHYLVSLAAWKLGACVLPLNPRLPPAEREALLALADPALVVADWDGLNGPRLTRAELEGRRTLSADPLPDRIAEPGKAIASGGSTGTPKIIVDPNPWAFAPGAWLRGLPGRVGMRRGQTQIVPGPLYFNAAFTWSHLGLFEEHMVVVMERFDASRFMELVERHRVNFGFLVPTMMRRILDAPGVAGWDLSSVEAFFHTAAPCPPAVKERWIEVLGGERLYEAFGATEAVGFTIIRGDEWLEHRGSVGRPADTEVRTLDEDGEETAPGVVGEVYMRRTDTDRPTFRYLGDARARRTDDGFVSVGDLGWLDEDGYLYLADRRTDLILTGGANVYPAEVEAVLFDHPGVLDVVVLGVPDRDWGQRVHAVVQPRDPAAAPTADELIWLCRERLTSYKVPKTFEFVDALQRDPSGKVRRSAMARERAMATAESGAGPEEAGA